MRSNAMLGGDVGTASTTGFPVDREGSVLRSIEPPTATARALAAHEQNTIRTTTEES